MASENVEAIRPIPKQEEKREVWERKHKKERIPWRLINS
jgi:hypothetical protein